MSFSFTTGDLHLCAMQENELFSYLLLGFLVLTTKSIFCDSTHYVAASNKKHLADRHIIFKYYTLCIATFRRP